jgi:ATP-dependent Lon protease
VTGSGSRPYVFSRSILRPSFCDLHLHLQSEFFVLPYSRHRDLQHPDRLPVVPLRDVVVIPYALMPLLIGRPASLSAVDAAASTPERWMVLVTQRNAEVSEPAAPDLYRVGVIVRLQQVSRTPSGGARVLVEAVGRVRITRFVSGAGHLAREHRRRAIPHRGAGHRGSSAGSGRRWRASRNTSACSAGSRRRLHRSRRRRARKSAWRARSRRT